MNSKGKIMNFSGLLENQRSTQALFRICLTVQLQQGDTKNTCLDISQLCKHSYQVVLTPSFTFKSLYLFKYVTSTPYTHSI